VSTPDWECVRRLRFGAMLRLFRDRWGHILPDDDAGSGDLWALVCNASLACKEPEMKMRNVIELWAPWMHADEREAYVKHVWGLDIYKRTPSAKEYIFPLSNLQGWKNIFVILDYGLDSLRVSGSFFSRNKLLLPGVGCSIKRIKNSQ
jgi:hypothetical protein